MTPLRRKNSIRFIIATALVLTLLGGCGSRPPVRTQPAPDFTLADADGQPVSLASWRGTPVLLNFWAMG